MIMKLKDVILKAVNAYPEQNLLAVDPEEGKQTLNGLLERGRRNDFGDGLLAFIIVELYEGLNEGKDVLVSSDSGLRLIRRAIADLEAVASALEGLE